MLIPDAIMQGAERNGLRLVAIRPQEGAPPDDHGEQEAHAVLQAVGAAEAAPEAAEGNPAQPDPMAGNLVEENRAVAAFGDGPDGAAPMEGEVGQAHCGRAVDLEDRSPMQEVPAAELETGEGDGLLAMDAAPSDLTPIPMQPLTGKTASALEEVCPSANNPDACVGEESSARVPKQVDASDTASVPAGGAARVEAGLQEPCRKDCQIGRLEANAAAGCAGIPVVNTQAAVADREGAIGVLTATCSAAAASGSAAAASQLGSQDADANRRPVTLEEDEAQAAVGPAHTAGAADTKGNEGYAANDMSPGAGYEAIEASEADGQAVGNDRPMEGRNGGGQEAGAQINGGPDEVASTLPDAKPPLRVLHFNRNHVQLYSRERQRDSLAEQRIRRKVCGSPFDGFEWKLCHIVSWQIAVMLSRHQCIFTLRLMLSWRNYIWLICRYAEWHVRCMAREKLTGRFCGTTGSW